MLEKAYQRNNGASEEEDQEDRENDDENEKLIKSNNKSKRDEFEVTEELKDGNKELEAGVKAHQGRQPNMYEKPETRDVMIKTNPDDKHDEVNVVRERGNVRQGQA